MEFHGKKKIMKFHGIYKLHGFPWISVDLHGLSMDYHGLQLISMELRVSPWNSVYLHGTPWIFMEFINSMKVHGIPWNSI
jgi:TorA maturation chaperone TorD